MRRSISVWAITVLAGGALAVTSVRSPVEAAAATTVNVPLACILTLDAVVVGAFSSSVDLGVTAPTEAQPGVPTLVSIEFPYSGASLKSAELAIAGAVPTTGSLFVGTSNLSMVPVGAVGSSIEIRVTHVGGGPSIPGATVSCTPTGDGLIASIPIVADPCAQPTLVGTPNADTLAGTRDPDVIAGLGGDDVVRGRGGDDVVCGGPGDDRLVGGRGNDRIDGGAGTDHCRGEALTACER